MVLRMTGMRERIGWEPKCLRTLIDRYKEEFGKEGAPPKPGQFLLNVYEEVTAGTDVLVDEDRRAFLRL